jgi:outer membrane lipoprotein carrier protein
MRRSTLLLLAFSAVAAPAGAQQGDAAIDKAVAAWANIRTLRADFQQSVVNPLTRRVETSRGHYQQQGSSRLSIRFVEPAGDRIVADGSNLWIYLPSTAPNQVMKGGIGDGAGGVDLTSQFLSSPRSRYSITDAGAATIGGRTTRALLLVPKPQQALPFSRARVWIDDQDGLLRQFEVTDANGLTRRVEFSNIRVNVPVDAAEFRFTPPRGAKVVQR